MIKCLPTGPLKVNTYIVSLGGNNVFVVDPASCSFSSDEDVIVKYLNDNNLCLCAIVLTHGHFDHVSGIPYLKKCFPNVPVCIHQEDAQFLGGKDAVMQVQSLEAIGFTDFLPQVQTLPNYDCLLQKDKTLSECLKLDSELSSELMVEFSKWKVVHTPGHTKGSVCIYSSEQKTLIAGDTIFVNSFGRTDLPGGSQEDLIDTLSFLYSSFKEDVKVYPGHGEYGFTMGGN